MKKKILITVIIGIITTLTLMPMLVAADVELPSYVDFPEGVDPETDRYTIIHKSNDTFNLIKGSVWIIRTFSSPTPILKYYTSNTTHYISNDLKEWSLMDNPPTTITLYNANIIYASQDIKWGSETDIPVEQRGTVFFYQKPAPYTKVILRPLVQHQQMSQALSQVLTILPLLVGLVVSFLAFRKAWSILLLLLHKA